MNPIFETVEDGKGEALIQARRNEKATGERWYVCRRHDGVWMLTDSMPMMGEWYDSDGHRHG
jgi:hypothetical protein